MRSASRLIFAALCGLWVSALGCSSNPASGESCGNGKVEGRETCDDGNLRDGDGCSATCQIEPAVDCAGTAGGQARLDACNQCVGGTTGKTACVEDCAGVWGGQAAIDGCSQCVGGTTGKTACVEDCAGVWGGQAAIDGCSQCVGGSTGKAACVQDCAGAWGGQAAIDGCSQCVGGTTGKTACVQDCAGAWGGQAAIDGCSQCVGGTTGKTACVQDCAGVWGGQAAIDGCGQCVGGTTGKTACAKDCAGAWGGQAAIDGCGQCVGGTTGKIACAKDCAGVWGGQAAIDGCSQCVGGTTGKTACAKDCAGVWGGQAALDGCGQCVGGTTGKTACAKDCAGVWGGQAAIDGCGQCVGGTTGKTACVQDCAGVWGGQAAIDGCGQCAGGTTGKTACAKDCVGVWGGQATIDPCGQCVGGDTGKTACAQDCTGAWGGSAQTDACNRCTEGTTGRTACSSGACLLGAGETVQGLVDNPLCAVVALPEGAFRGPIRVDLATMNGKRSVEVRGVSRDGTVFQGGGAQVFWVEAGAGLRLSALTIRGNNGLAGAALYNRGTASLDGVAVTNNTASIFGSIVNADHMEIRASVISGNATDAASSAFGGGIYNTGSLFVGGTSIAGNRAIADGNDFGGGVCNDGGNVTIEDSDISGNVLFSSINAGGTVEGAGIFSYLGTVDLQRTTVHHNRAENVGNAAHGGGISAWGSTVALSPECAVSFNEAIAQNEVYGAGIYLERAQLRMDGVTVEGNRGQAGLYLGGAAVMAKQASLSLAANRLANNRLEATGTMGAQIFGGVLYVREGTLTMTGGQIVENAMVNGWVQGGLIRVDDYTSPSEVDEALYLDGVELAGNTVTTSGEVDGGLLWAVGRLRLKDSNLHSNTVTSTAPFGSVGGLVYFVEWRNSSPGSPPAPGEFVIEGTRLVGNTVANANHGLNGGLLYAWVDRAGPVVPTLRASTILGNTVSSAHGVIRGGLLYLDEPRHVSISDSTLSSNAITAGVDGGSPLSPGTIQGGVLYHSFTAGSASDDDGRVELVRTDVSQNQVGTALATDGIHGGVLMLYAPFHADGHLLTYAVTNSTFGLNAVRARSAVDGGLLSAFNNQGSAIRIALSNATLAQNQADGPLGTVSDLAPNHGAAALLLRNTILSQNATAGDADCVLQGAPPGAIASSGYNLLGEVSACVGLTLAPSDRVGLDPLFGAYGGNGGPMSTLPILPASPAVDGGDPAGCLDDHGVLLLTDQRGLPRPAGSRCDVGAFELQTP